MKLAPVYDGLYVNDFVRRAAPVARPRRVHLAHHLGDHLLFESVAPLLAAIRRGCDLRPYLSPMKSQRAAFKRAHNKGDWSLYRRQMDHLLNKWGIYHFHCNEGKTLVFVHFADHHPDARIVEIMPHDRNWRIERRLIEVVVNNWPDAGIVVPSGTGVSAMSEADLLLARKRGLNMPVEVAGVFYLPAAGGIMSDGTGFSNLGPVTPIVYTARRYSAADDPDPFEGHPQIVVIGVDPNDPRPPWEVGAAYAGAMVSRRRRGL